jgi:hypothetical protein
VEVEVLPCGHVAHQGARLLCQHLLDERADELETFWVLRGVGVEYDLCCTDCAAAGGYRELVPACEGCVARADDPWSVIGVIGEPEIRRRPEPVDTTLARVRLPVPPLDVAAVDDCPGEWLLLTPEHVLRWSARTAEVTARCKISLPSSGPERKISLPSSGPERKSGKPPLYRIHASPGGEFAVIAVDYRQYGTVIDLARGRVAMTLDRGSYHVEQTPFPVAFLRVDGQLLLAHATAWNRVDLSDPATGVTLTPRQFQAAERQRPAHYLDYFYGALYPAPDGSLIATDGWVWHPMGVPRVWDARRWRQDYVYEAEDGISARSLRQVVSYWDHPMCWLDGTRLAVSGLGVDDLTMIRGVEIYDAGSGACLASFAGPAGQLYCAGDRLYSSSPGGVHIWDIQTGANTGTVTGFVPTRYHPGSRELAAVEDDVLATWSMP